MMKISIVLCALVSLSLGLPAKLPPYPAKGWKPQGARLELPNERTESIDVETTTLSNEYLPPTSTEYEKDENDVLRVQGLPSTDSTSQFKSFQPDQKSNIQARPILARIQAPAFVGHPFLLSPMFAPQFVSPSAQLNEIKFERVEEPSDDKNKPKDDAQQMSIEMENVQPQRTYGPPLSTNNIPVEDVTTPAELSQGGQNQPEPGKNGRDDDDEDSDDDDDDEENQGEEEDDDDDENEEGSEDDDDDDDDDGQEGTVIAISNAKSNANYVDEKQQGQHVGQYYILLPDNSLQKVRFATQQTEEDRQTNGFSAQLRYSPVEAIRDPVYGYDEQGKLVRFYK